MIFLKYGFKDDKEKIKLKYNSSNFNFHSDF